MIQTQIKEWLTLLHIPTTSSLLALIVVGMSTPPSVNLEWLVWLLLEAFLMVGVASNCFDEIRGRPWKTSIPSCDLWSIALGGYLLSTAIGVYLASRVGSWFLLFVGAWCFLVPAYSLELFGGRLHNEWTIGLAVFLSSLCSALIQSPVLTPQRLVISTVCAAIGFQGRRLYEKGKAAGKDHAGDAAARKYWHAMSVGVFFIDITAVILVLGRIFL